MAKKEHNANDEYAGHDGYDVSHASKGGSHTKHGKSKKKGGLHHQQGRIRHPDMTSLINGHGSTDPHAHSSHKANNKAFGTHEGLSPEGDYDHGEDGCGGAMGENCEFE